MATAASFILLIAVSATIAHDVQLVYKSPSKPVRLFTEEELQSYDGREVTTLPLPPTPRGSFISSMSVQYDMLSRVFLSLFVPLSKEDQPIYMAVKGVVFDVTGGKGK